MVYDEAMHADQLMTYMRRLIKDAGRKVFLILGRGMSGMSALTYMRGIFSQIER